MSDVGDRLARLSPAKRALFERMASGTQPAAAPAAIPRRANRALAPLSFAQERLWFLHQLDPDSPAYTVAHAVSYRGRLDRSLVESALAHLVARHDTLRTVVREENGAPVQHIEPDVAPALSVVDLSALDAERAAIELRELAQHTFEQPFSLERGPLFRTTLIRLAPDHHALLFALHHIVADAASMERLVREFSACYAALAQGRPPELAALPIQFGDYAVWHRDWFSGPVRDAQLGYWTRQLAGIQPIDLPIDAPRPPVQTFVGREHRFSLGATLTSSLRALARRNDATMFMTLLSGFAAFLHRYSRQPDIVVGSPIANRGRIETEPLIGLFANTIVLRIDCSGDPSADTLIARTRQIVLDAHEHQDLPFEQLVEKLSPERDLSRNPLFQVFFVHRRLARDSGTAGIDAVEVPATTTKFDVTMTFEESADDIVGLLEYNRDLFTDATARRMAAHLTTLLSAMATEPSAPIDSLTMIDGTERAALLLEGPDPEGAERHATLPSMFAKAVALNPDQEAVVCGSDRLTYQQLDARSIEIGTALRERGVGSGALVGISLERSTDLVAAALAVVRVGAAYVPLDPSFPPERLRQMIDDAKPTEIIDAAWLEAALAEADLRVGPAGRQARRHTIDPDDLAYVIYTSGSTGRPKGVQIPHRALANLLSSMQREPGVTASDRLVAVTTFSFDIAGLELWLPLITGATVVVATQDEARDGRALAGLLARERATLMQATPSTWRLLLDAGWNNPERIRVLVGGEALPVDLAGSLIGVAPECWNVYGPTETTIWSTLQRVTEVGGTVPIGRPIARTRAYVLDDRLEPVPHSVLGDLYLAGDGLARGYLHLADLTADRFVPDPHATVPGSRMYRTGDRARVRHDGVLEFAGRADDQIKLRGFRIELGDVEAALIANPSVERAAAGLRPGADGSPVLVAWCVCANGAAVDVSALRTFLRDRLADYMIPSVFVPIDRLPLTPNNKVDRRALPALEAAPRRRDLTPPRTDRETAIATLWRELLKMDEIGTGEDFFELGGHSMLAARLLSRVRDAFHVDVPLRALFETPTIAGLSRAVSILEDGGTLELLTAALRAELLADSRLDPAIAPQSENSEPETQKSEPRTVLLTGATGFLGAHLLVELLDRGLTVLCLVRCSDPTTGFLRVREILEKYEIWRGDDSASRIVIVPGDLASPRLGLRVDDFERLASSIDAIYHNGALVNFVTPYRQLRAANVLGTREVLRLACTRTAKPVHYVSTTDVLGGAFLTMTETDPLVDPAGLPHGYGQSKWVAERLVAAARERGLPVAIYRPGRIVGHSQTGIWNTDDFACRAVRGSIELGVVPDLDPLDNMSPVDFVARAIVHLSRTPDAFAPGAFHVINPEFYLWRRLFDFMRRQGYPLVDVTYREWRRRLGDAQENALKPLLPLFSIPPEDGADGSGQRWTDLPIPNCARATAGLAGAVACPPLDDALWTRYFAFFVRSGYIEAPGAEPPGLQDAR